MAGRLWNRKWNKQRNRPSKFMSDRTLAFSKRQTAGNDDTYPRCSIHQGDPVTEFSLKFEQCMCLRCATNRHETLSDFLPVSQCVHDKREEAYALFDHIAEVSKTAKSFRRDRHKFVENIKEAERNIKGTVKKVKSRLIRHIDNLESKLISSLTKLVITEKKSAKSVFTDLRSFEEHIGNIRDHVANSLDNGNDFDVVTTVTDGKKSVERLCEDVEFPDDSISQKSLQFRVSPIIAEFLDRVTDLGEVSLQTGDTSLQADDISDGEMVATNLSFGLNANANALSPELKFVATTSPSITTSYAESRLTEVPEPLHTSSLSHLTSELYQRENGAVTMRRPHNSGLGRHNGKSPEKLGKYLCLPKLSEDRKVGTTSKTDHNIKQNNGRVGESSAIFTAEHDGPCNLNAVAALGSGWVVVCDSNHKCIQLVDRNSEILDDLLFHHKPCSIARISDSSFAVSFATKDYFGLFNVDNRRFSHVRDIRIGGKGGNYSLAFSGNKFAVCRKGEIRLLSSDDGSLLDTIPTSTTSPQIVMSDAGTKLYVSDSDASKITCMTNLGKTIWEFKNGHMRPTSLALDLNRLFITDTSGRVFILSTYGDLVKEITCGGLLRAVSVDPRSGNLVLTQDSKERVLSRTVKIVNV